MIAKHSLGIGAALLLSGCAVTVPLTPDHPPMQRMIERRAADELGPQWVPVALRIAWTESRFNPNAIGPLTRHGRAVGTFQVLPSSAKGLGYNPHRLREPAYGVDVGVAHMRECIRAGVATDRQMAACHIAGLNGWHSRSRTVRTYVERVTR
jgi:hypothetical protein